MFLILKSVVGSTVLALALSATPVHASGASLDVKGQQSKGTAGTSRSISFEMKGDINKNVSAGLGVSHAQTSGPSGKSRETTVSGGITIKLGN